MRKKVKRLEAELRYVASRLRTMSNVSELHARHNKWIKRYIALEDELARVSLKWKIKRFIRKVKRGKRK